MNLIPFKELPAHCGIEWKNLYTYKGRGQIIVDKDGNVDLDNEINRLFLAKKAAKKAKKGTSTAPETKPNTPVVVVKKQSKQPVFDDEEAEEAALAPLMSDADIDKLMGGRVLPPDESFALLQHRKAIKTQLENQKLTLDIEKKKGIVVPSAPIMPIFLQHNQHILTEIKNAQEEMLTAFAHKYGISGSDVAYIRGDWTKRLNVAMQKAVEASAKGVESIINDYSDKRAVGERDR